MCIATSMTLSCYKNNEQPFCILTGPSEAEIGTVCSLKLAILITQGQPVCVS